MNFRKHSSQTELDTFFQKHLSLSDDIRHVTKSAFFQARKKLSYHAFIALNRQLVESLYKQKQHIKTWKGFRLCAIDGTAIRLPDTAEISEHFGRHSGRVDRGSCAMGMASVFYDVMNHIVIDSTLQKNKSSERDCAAKHLTFSTPNDLVIYDRGYPAHWLFQLHKQKGVPFCMRAKTQQSAIVKAFLRTGKKDEIVTFSPHYYSALTCKEKGLPKTAIKLRLIRVELPNTIEVLITSLCDSRKYHHRIFKSLYHLRWGVEENYKRLKQWIEIENFSGKSVLSVKQDFYAKILSANLTQLISSASEKTIKKRNRNSKISYKINMAQAISKMKHRIVAIISNHQQRGHLIARAVNYIGLTIEAIRNGRSAPRKSNNINNKVHHMAYKCSL